jgi:peptidoglycan/LPS O-acetylase OafA/YrhL
MRFPYLRRPDLLTVLTIVLGAVVAVLLLLLGVANLIHPDVPPAYLAQNTRICAWVCLVGVLIVYALFRPRSGGVLLCIMAVPMGYKIPAVGGLALLLGVLSVIRGRRSPRTVPAEPDQAA